MGYARVGRPCGLTGAVHALVLAVSALLAVYGTLLVDLLLRGQAYRPAGFRVEDYVALLYPGPEADPLVVTPRMESQALRIEPRSGPDGYLLRLADPAPGVEPSTYDRLRLYLRVSFRYAFTSVSDVLEYTYRVGDGGLHRDQSYSWTSYLRTTDTRGNCSWPRLYGGVASDYYDPPQCASGFHQVNSSSLPGPAGAGVTLQVNETFVPLPGSLPETAEYFYLRFYFYAFAFLLLLWAFYTAGRHVVVFCSGMDGGSRRYPEAVKYG